jgi:CheY-like chemotaxis protein/HPt (histidine-containing phosphotransfer) domain-containing protein
VAAATPRTRWSLPSARVLVVDDGPENRELIALVLAEHGLWIDEAENGQVALDRMAAETYDLVLMDMQMPVMDGYTATRAIRARGLQVPVVALTANAMKGYEEEVLAAGCTVYLTKPVDIDALLQQVAQLLGGKPQEAAAVAEVKASSVFTEVPADEGPVRSRFATNPKLAPIVRKFAARLHEQLGVMGEAVAARDWPEVQRLGHWLAGAAGTVGYDSFTEPARELETSARAGDAAAAEGWLQRILRMAEQIEVPDAALG